MCSNNNENNNNYRVRPEQQLHSRLQIAPASEALLRAILANRNIKSLFRLFACTVRSCRQLARNAHTHTYKSDNLIYHCTLSGTETGAAHTHTHSQASTVCVRGCALRCSLGRWLRPKIVHEIMAVSAVCHILGHLWVRFYFQATRHPRQGIQVGDAPSMFWTNCGAQNERQRSSSHINVLNRHHGKMENALQPSEMVQISIQWPRLGLRLNSREYACGLVICRNGR